ncbi:hypothetical protein RDI58_007293 [Solanum bulbocastanum]|uniref:Uncharacterized protein n=1 Tax=Solanum bulbocastanum TaxID=147425 RepID=A0AAN8YIH0_SOLBU
MVHAVLFFSFLSQQ